MSTEAASRKKLSSGSLDWDHHILVSPRNHQYRILTAVLDPSYRYLPYPSLFRKSEEVLLKQELNCIPHLKGVEVMSSVKISTVNLKFECHLRLFQDVTQPI
ncbi:uncharacterized protein RBU57_017232 isoform 1-T1 [Macrochelys suwanniensis]